MRASRLPALSHCSYHETLSDDRIGHLQHCREWQKITVVAEECLCIDIENVMATAEQMQEALHLQQHELQVLGARMAALETQLQFESGRAQTAEQERSALIQNSGNDSNEPWQLHG